MLAQGLRVYQRHTAPATVVAGLADRIHVFAHCPGLAPPRCKYGLLMYILSSQCYVNLYQNKKVRETYNRK